MTSKAKNRNKKTLSKKTKRSLIIGIIAAVIVICALSIILYLRKKENDRTVRIAFCGLSQEISEIIQKEIPESEELNLVFTNLNKNDLDLGVVSGKFDMLFTYEGELTETLGKSSEEIPGRILQSIPISLRNTKPKQKRFPILLDHYEMAFYEPLRQKYGLDYPESWDDFTAYLEEASKHVFTPFFCEGSNDRTLLALVGAVVQAQGGLEAYGRLCAALKAAENLEAVMDVPLAVLADGAGAGTGAGDGDGSLTVRGVLDMFREWARDGLVHPLWYIATKNDVLYFMEDNQIAVLFDSLTEHRTVPYSIIKNYESLKVPEDLSVGDHGVIAPAVVCMLLSNNMNNDDFLRPFAAEEVQGRLSMLSKLAPTQYRAESYDKQADDVRFWVAACKGGSLPDLSLAVYQRNADAMTALAAEIRQYLKMQ